MDKHLYYQGNSWGDFFHPIVTTYPHLHTSPRCRNRLQELNPRICRQLPFPGRPGAEAAGHSALAHRMGGGAGEDVRAGFGCGTEKISASVRAKKWNGMEWDGMGWDGMVCVDTFVFTLFSWNKNKTIWKWWCFWRNAGMMNDLPYPKVD